MNEKITSKDINKNYKLQSTLNLDKRQDDPLISIKQKNKHISTVLSQYNDKIDAHGKMRPVTMKNKLWKTANRRRFGFAPQYHSSNSINFLLIFELLIFLLYREADKIT